ncbi:nitroreductase/quinone reductase family protein [Nocardia sp. 2YAB30]|uniref:nitroreductase/quinone reductase family protein n=1 Tax=unclassified Nocardia TaxID=2637762 RepID=UPI003F9ADFC5
MNELGLPRWLKPMNKVVLILIRLGVPLGTMRGLSVPGRKTGQLRTTPVSPLTVDGHRYIVGHESTQWTRNARAAGWAILTERGRRNRIALIEVPPDQRAAVLRRFPAEVPGGVPFFIKIGLVTSADPNQFAAAAPHCAVFRIELPQA